MRRNYGWIRSNPDQRDHRYAGTLQQDGPIDLRTRLDQAGKPLLGKTWYQGGLGTCQSHAVGKAWQYVLGTEGRAHPVPSRLFIYWNARSYSNTQQADIGATIRDTMQAVHDFGAPAERVWPYIQKKFGTRPVQEAFDQAERREVIEYLSVAQDPDGASIKSSLAEGFPVVIGFTMYDGSQPYAGNGWYQPLPRASESIMAHHAVLVVGHKIVRNKPCWIVMDSAIGDDPELNHGYWFMDERYLFNPDLSADFWTLRKVS